MKTTEDILIEKPISYFYDKNTEQMVCFEQDVKLAMKEYATEIIKEIAEKAETESAGFYLEGEFIPNRKVNKNSILKFIKKLK